MCADNTNFFEVGNLNLPPKQKSPCALFFKKAISISKTSGGNLEIVSTYVESRPNFAVLQSFHEKSLQNTRQLQNNYLRIGRIYQRS